MPVPKEYTSIQPVSEPEGLFRSTVNFGDDPNLRFEGEGSYYESDSDISVTNEKRVNYRMVIGTDRSLYGLLKKNKDLLANGPYHMDSRDGGITIHNHNFNQPPKYVYTYMGGNGELLSCDISTHKKAMAVQAQQASTIDPLTKEVSTTVTQVCGDVNETVETQGFTSFQRNLWANLNGLPDPKEQERQARIRSAKTEAETKKELQSTYQATKEDIQKYVSELRSKFNDLYNKAKTSGDITPLLRLNSLKGVVKVKKEVKTVVNPSEYGGNPEWASSYTNKVEYFANYNRGLKYLKSNPNIIVLGYTNSTIDVMTKEKESSTPLAVVIMEKEIELELDGARIMSSPLAKDMQEYLVNNTISDRVQKEVKMNLKVVGRPGLVSSLILQINNLSERYSGEWYTKKVTHRINSSGYLCTSELIKKVPLVTLSSTTSRVDTKNIYTELHKVAKDNLGSVKLTEASLAQAFNEYVKSDDDLKDKSLVLDLNNSNPETGDYNIYPASDDHVSITKEREKHRR